MPYPIGSVYGRDIAFAPPVPANVTVTATLYPNSILPRPRPHMERHGQCRRRLRRFAGAKNITLSRR